ncbi:MAG: ABC transporter substrate-binding protein [Acaryochloris sp. RU_4_1]|nr:ABC transporter substrate-binding protein [Acaryochloris sp. RU_4_1]
MRRREVLRSSALFALGTLSTAILGSCGNQSTTQGIGGGSLQSKSPLRVALIPWVGWGSAHVAEVKDFFKAEGIEVKQTVFQTVSEVNTALLSKQVDLAWLVALDLLVLSAQTPDLKFIYASDYSGEVDAIVSHGISSPADLKGKKIAREDIPYEIAFTGKYIDSIGLTEKDVEILSLPVPDATSAFVTGKVDAATIYEPFIGKALKERPGSKILYTAKGSNIIANGLAGSQALLQDRREDVSAYLRAVDKAVKFQKDNVLEAYQILAKWTGTTDKEISGQLTRIKLHNIESNKSVVFNASDKLYVAKGIDAAAPVLKRTGKIAKALPGKDLVDDSFIKAL